jgi:A/G-specific adenine glycosylase
MLQQTTVKSVIPYFLKFIDKWATVHDLAAAPQEEIMDAWAGLGYYSRARNLYKCAKTIVEKYLGVFPSDQKELRSLSGIGEYTSAAIAAIAFDKPASVIDGNVERVLSRYCGTTEPFPSAKKQIRIVSDVLTKDRMDRSGDYAQATMDLGATVCTPKSPQCGLCPLQSECKALALNLTAIIPVSAPKRAKPQKFGHIYWITDDQGRVLFERRPDTVMLGGTIGLPTSLWLEDRNNIEHIDIVKNFEFKAMKIPVRHSFTHFDLKLTGIFLVNPPPTHPPLHGGCTTVGGGNYFFQSPKSVPPSSLPTVFRKFYVQALTAR